VHDPKGSHCKILEVQIIKTRDEPRQICANCHSERSEESPCPEPKAWQSARELDEAIPKPECPINESDFTLTVI